MSAITTHVLDVGRGRPARGVPVALERVGTPQSTLLARATTDADGRVNAFTPTPAIQPGTYRLSFEVGTYFASAAIEAFYQRIVIEFEVRDATQDYHVPVLLSPYGYSTYRGS
ncbi:MAG TPA: hydroxyisourate hydrolase [Gemmatimonadaceae bacterium]|nr:hydroxyisourate hydrolase [Gemmatimonadaceae bacterium]